MFYLHMIKRTSLSVRQNKGWRMLGFVKEKEGKVRIAKHREVYMQSLYAVERQYILHIRCVFIVF
jgi:hypothetical protein